MKYKNLLLLLFCLCGVGNISAQQWSFDVYGGINLCYPTLEHSYGAQYQESVKLSWPWDDSYTNRFNGGVSAHYYFNKWWGVRVDVNYQMRTYGEYVLSPRMVDEGLAWNGYAVYSPSNLLSLPMMGSFIVPIRKWSLYLEAGPYLGLFVKELPMNQKSRFEVGIVGAIGAKFQISKDMALKAECMCFQSLNDNHETGSRHFQQPIYYTVPSFNLGICYNLNK